MRLISVFGLSIALAASPLAADDARPLRALLITGGGYHDYEGQKKILTEGLSARANVAWTVVLENPKPGELPRIYAEKDWADGYDVIVHNECFAQYSDAEGIERIVKDHLERGVGAVMIHCAMHTFRDGKTNQWDKLVGVQSRRHGPKFPIVVRNVKPDHPIMLGFPRSWTTPMGELYHTSILPGATELALGYKAGEEESTRQTCIWANRYEDCRVFATTIGHHNETMQEKEYLDLVARGLLWTCGKLDESGKPAKGYGKTAAATNIRFKVVLAGGKTDVFPNADVLPAGIKAARAKSCCGE